MHETLCTCLPCWATSKRCMSLLNITVSNCAFALDFSALEEDKSWFVQEIMKKTDTMSNTREAVANFNHQLSIAIRVKKLIQE